jgi:uncharacterized membrane protein YbhN (UPF0104 family)
MKRKQLLHLLEALFGLFLFLLALWILHRELHQYPPKRILEQLRLIPRWRLGLGALLTCLSYLLLTGYDTLAFRYIRHPLPYGRIGLASFIGYAVGNNTGSLSVIAGSGVRLRLYSAWGLTPLQVTKVVVFCFLTFWLGFLFLGGTVFFLEPFPLPPALPLPEHILRFLGLIFLALVALYLLLVRLRHKPLIIGLKSFNLPPMKLSLTQILLASFDWALVGSVLYALLPDKFPFSFPAFLSIFMLAQVIGLISQVPGGLGVFESMFILLLPDSSPHVAVLGSLLVFRTMYYFIPLAVAALWFGGYEFLVLRKRRRKRKK